jgi:exo-beta-1,3-glucanase (GH17 family)
MEEILCIILILLLLCCIYHIVSCQCNDGFNVGGQTMCDPTSGGLCPGGIACPNCGGNSCECPIPAPDCTKDIPQGGDCSDAWFNVDVKYSCNAYKNGDDNKCENDNIIGQCRDTMIPCDGPPPGPPGPPGPSPPGPSPSQEEYFGMCIDDTSIISKTFRNITNEYNMYRLYRWDLPKVKNVADELVNMGKKIMIGISVKGRTNQDIINDVEDIVKKINDPTLGQKYKENLMSVSIGNEYGMAELPLVKQGLILVKDRIKQLISNLKITSCLLFNGDTIKTPFTTPKATWPELKYGPILNDIKDDIDVVSVNVYTLDGWQPGSSGDIIGISFDERDSLFYNMISQIRNVIGNDKEFWVTEIGWPYKFTGDDPGKIRNPTNQKKFINNIKSNLTKNKMITQNGDLYSPKIQYKVPDKIFLFCVDCNYVDPIGQSFGLNNCS